MVEIPPPLRDVVKTIQKYRFAEWKKDFLSYFFMEAVSRYGFSYPPLFFSLHGSIFIPLCSNRSLCLEVPPIFGPSRSRSAGSQHLHTLESEPFVSISALIIKNRIL